ncbi:TM2 domain-containing protein [Aureitalea sp. L0-47]|uniref:TM2 domain-containing protein n=1 Tax=Aureitalea sp. L0-47 TaxID=2816962 RepID=UPI002238CD65|nr:TM2 domain-containing protein [Aureitalea sp. L0-47]MCW5518399.1 TM2 domain-containing protein [Aureitalea sp. L0-47]
MKLKIVLSALIFVLCSSPMFASFPVERTVQSSAQVSEHDTSEVVLESPAASALGDELLVSLLLWFFLGWAAGHRWYLGSPVGWNILFIVTLGGLGVWWLVDGIQIITGTY